MTEQGYPPRQPGRYGRSRVSQEPRKTGWQVIDAFDDAAGADSDLPPWAVPGGIEPIRPVRRREPVPEPEPEPEPLDEPEPVVPAYDAPARRGRIVGRSRAALARRRRSKRRLVTWGSAVLVVAAIVGAGLFLAQSPAPKSPWISDWQKGEIQTVPNACKVVSAATLSQYLGGKPAALQPLSVAGQSQCAYTVDAKPTFRVLNINVIADKWSVVPIGNGSATANATANFATLRQGLAHPPKHAALPAATVAEVAGLGDEAISAVQVVHVGGGSVTDRVTVLARYRNVLIDVYLQGQASGGYGPVSIPDLTAGATLVARSVLADVRTGPTAG